jgi:hypothetical protein
MTLSDYFKKKNAVKVGTPLKPMGEFPLIDAHDVIVDYDEATGKETRLDEKLKNVGNSNLELDTSLSREGYAADAKAVGDRIASTLGDIQSVLERI